MKTNNKVETNKKNWVERRASGELAWWMEEERQRREAFLDMESKNGEEDMFKRLLFTWF